MITVLTPTYNRSELLSSLYKSLLMQTVNTFEWLIVDDGSTDSTEIAVNEWEREGLINLKYVYQQNGGKHTAINTGVAHINTELTFIVDSDDYLPENAIEIILRYHEKYKKAEGLCGYSFLRFYPDGTVNEAYFPEEELIDTYVNVRINGGIAGDKAEVYYTEVLKKFPFPVYEGEKFVPEDLIWVQMSGPFKMVHINQCVYISDYLEDGLTRSGKRMKVRSPKAMTKRSEIYLNDYTINKKTKYKMILLYIIYGHIAQYGSRELLLRLHGVFEKGLYIGGFIPGILIYRAWSLMYR